MGDVYDAILPDALKLHTYIMNLLHSSVYPKTVQYLAGHESSKITMDIYAKVKYNKPDELAAVLNGVFAQWDAPNRERHSKERESDSCGVL